METATELEAARQASLDLLVDTYLHAFRAADVETALSTLAEDVELDLVGSTPSSIRLTEAVRAHHLQHFANTIHERHLPLPLLYAQGFTPHDLPFVGRI